MYQDSGWSDRVCPPPARRVVPGAIAGLAYLEVLIATVLIMLALAPALESLAPGVAGSVIHASRIEDQFAVAGRLEELLTAPFADLDAAALAAGSPDTASSYSDSVIYPDGRQVRRAVYLSRYDSDNADADDDPFTGTEDDLIWLRVEIAGEALETLICACD